LLCLLVEYGRRINLQKVRLTKGRGVVGLVAPISHSRKFTSKSNSKLSLDGCSGDDEDDDVDQMGKVHGQ
jgi:hypothetical protein